MVARGARSYVVREGENIDPSYLLEKIDADRLVIRYMPLDQTQVLSFAATPAAVAPPRPNVQLAPAQQKRGAAPRDADDEED
jgi:hypothetical protein